MPNRVWASVEPILENHPTAWTPTHSGWSIVFQSKTKQNANTGPKHL